MFVRAAQDQGDRVVAGAQNPALVKKPLDVGSAQAYKLEIGNGGVKPEIDGDDGRGPQPQRPGKEGLGPQ